MKIIVRSVIAEAHDFIANPELLLVGPSSLMDYYGLALGISFSEGNDLAGTLAMEVTLDDEQAIRDGSAVWYEYSDFSDITDFSSPSLFVLDDKIFPFSGAKLVLDSGTGEGTARIVLNGCRV